MSEELRSAQEEGKSELEALREEIENLRRALEEEREKAQRFLSNWQRTQADLENLRKRVEQEKAELVEQANAELVANLLPVLDDFERALSSIPPSLQSFTWIEGLFLLHRRFLQILQHFGLSPIEALGRDFDPLYHEAIAYGDGEEGKVIEEYQKGYKFKGRVLRPALVKVGRREKGEEQK